MLVVLALFDVAVVLVSPSSVVTEVCDGFSLGSDWEFVEPQSFSFSKMRARVWTATQEEMRYESSHGKAPPLSRRRMMPPTPLQNSYSSFEGCRSIPRWRISFGVRITERLLQERNSTWK